MTLTEKIFAEKRFSNFLSGKDIRLSQSRAGNRSYSCGVAINLYRYAANPSPVFYALKIVFIDFPFSNDP